MLLANAEWPYQVLGYVVLSAYGETDMSRGQKERNGTGLL